MSSLLDTCAGLCLGLVYCEEVDMEGPLLSGAVLELGVVSASQLVLGAELGLVSASQLVLGAEQAISPFSSTCTVSEWSW